MIRVYTFSKLHSVAKVPNTASISDVPGKETETRGDKMMEMQTNTTISGTVCSEMEFSHEVYGEGFYNLYVSVPRLSEVNDVLPVTVSERLVCREI